MYSTQMKSLTEDIQASDETRKAAVSALAKETHQSLGNFHREHEKMASDLKRSLTSNKVRRTKAVQKMRAENGKSLKDMSKELTEFLSTSTQERIASESERKLEFAAWIGEIKDRVAALENDTADMLAAFRSEHEEMARALMATLADETRERIEAIHDLMSHFSQERKEQAEALRSELSSFQRSLSQMVGDMMADFSTDHLQARAHWNTMSRAMSAKRAGTQVPSAKAEKAPSNGKGNGGKKAKAEKQVETQ